MTYFNNIRYKFLILNCLCSIFYGCSPKDCRTKSGENITETRFVSGFHSLEINDIFNIELKNGNSPKIILETGANILSHIKTQVTDSTLSVSNDITCRFIRGFNKFPKLTIFVPENLKAVYINQASDIITIDTLAVSHILFRFLAKTSSAKLTLKTGYTAFELWNEASGNFELSGQTEYLFLLNDGFTAINAANFKSDFATVESYSAVSTSILVNKNLNATIFNSGNVLVKGNPEIGFLKELSTGKLLFVKK